MLSYPQWYGWGKSIVVNWEISERANRENKLFTYWLVVVFQAHHSSTQARKTIMGTNTVMVDKVLQKAWTSNITLMVISHNVNFPILHTCPLLAIHNFWMIFFFLGPAHSNTSYICLSLKVQSFEMENFFYSALKIQH